MWISIMPRTRPKPDEKSKGNGIRKQLEMNLLNRTLCHQIFYVLFNYGTPSHSVCSSLDSGSTESMTIATSFCSSTSKETPTFPVLLFRLLGSRHSSRGHERKQMTQRLNLYVKRPVFSLMGCDFTCTGSSCTPTTLTLGQPCFLKGQSAGCT